MSSRSFQPHLRGVCCKASPSIGYPLPSPAALSYAPLMCCRLMAWMSEAQLLLIGSSSSGTDTAVMLELQFGPGNIVSAQLTTLSCTGALA